MSISLIYWNGRGLMEPVRLMMALAGKKVNVDFKDGRYGKGTNLTSPIEPFDNIANELSHNLGRMPILKDDIESIGQSSAINYYVASQLGFMGESLIEASHILEIQEHLKELKSAYYNLIPYGVEPSQENLETWFEEGAKDISPNPANMANRKKRMMKWWCSRIEYLLGENYAVGEKYSLADILLYTTFRDYLKDSEISENVLSYQRFPFGSKARTDNILKKYPKINNICEKIENEPNIIEWLESRGNQSF